MADQYIHHFDDADFRDKDLLGGKGAGLARMVQAGYPVPPGFTIDTTACRKYLAGTLDWESFLLQLYKAMSILETKVGMRYGGSFNEFPLLVSVRSGAPVSMPGMMETVLNVGITAKNIPYMGDPRFSLSAYCEFLGAYGRVVLGQQSQRLSDPEGFYRVGSQLSPTEELTREQLEDMVVKTRARALRGLTDTDVSSAQTQLEKSIKAVFESSGGAKALAYKKYNSIDKGMCTAVNIVAMVYGNRNENSGTGVLFTRNPSTGEKALYGEYLSRAQGEKVVSGAVTPMSLEWLAEHEPSVYAQLTKFAIDIEADQREPQDIEFTVDDGTLWLLQHRKAHMTSRAQVVTAVDMVDEGLITRQEAVDGVGASAVKYANVPTLHVDGAVKVGVGLAASPGTAIGRASINGKLDASAESIILVRPLTSPEDVPDMLMATAFATGMGGTTSHAAVVARGENKPCVVGVHSWRFDGDSVRNSGGDVLFSDGDIISLDGGTGEVYLGALKLDDGVTATEHVARMEGWQTELGAVPKLSNKKLAVGLAHVEKESDSDKMAIPTAVEKAISHWWPELDLRLDLTTVAADFYLLSETARVNPGLQRAMDEYSEVLAKEVALYLDAACGGELRHMKGGFDGLTSYDRGLARREWRKTRMAKGPGMVTAMTNSFNYKSNWSSNSYGGQKWGQASSLLGRFLHGEMRPSTFVDMTFDLQHNGGCIFNKLQYSSFLGFGWNLVGLTPVLDLKLHGDFVELRLKASKPFRALFDLRDVITAKNVTVAGLAELGEVWAGADDVQPITSGLLPLVGSTVMIKNNTRSKDLRGRVVEVGRVRELKRDGKSVGWFVYFTLDGKERYAAVKNVIQVVNSGSKYRSYFNDEIEEEAGQQSKEGLDGTGDYV